MHAGSFTEEKTFFLFHFWNVEMINELLSVVLFNFYNIHFWSVRVPFRMGFRSENELWLQVSLANCSYKFGVNGVGIKSYKTTANLHSEGVP